MSWGDNFFFKIHFFFSRTFCLDNDQLFVNARIFSDLASSTEKKKASD